MKNKLAKVGSLEQLAYARRISYEEGRAGGLHGVQVKNKELFFVAAIDKCLDITEISYKGINLNFLSKPGLANRQHYDSNGFEAQRSIMGGLFFTCGTDNVGTPELEGPLPMHGTLRSTPAEHVCTDAFWQGDDYIIRISGQMRQAALFGENVVLRRTIETVYGSNRITLRDEFVNESFGPVPFMLLYHCNVGYPLLDEGSKIRIPSKKAVLRGQTEPTTLPWNEVGEPKPLQPEEVFFHDVIPNEKGQVTLSAVNEKLGLALHITYLQTQLPRLTQWKSMASGDYVVGLEPCNCHVNGQSWEKENGTLPLLQPGKSHIVDLEFMIEELSE